MDITLKRKRRSSDEESADEFESASPCRNPRLRAEQSLDDSAGQGNCTSAPTQFSDLRALRASGRDRLPESIAGPSRPVCNDHTTELGTSPVCVHSSRAATISPTAGDPWRASETLRPDQPFSWPPQPPPACPGAACTTWVRIGVHRSSVPGAVHFHLPLSAHRYRQLTEASPEDMQAVSNFFGRLFRGLVPARQPPAWHEDAPTPDFKIRWERAAAHFMRLPLETYYDHAALERMSIRELRDLMQDRHLCQKGMLEKADMIMAVLKSYGTSSTRDTCPICSEAYVSGEDTLRALPCSHRFHIECIDHWFLNPVDYAQKPSCPICKKELPAG